MTISPLTAMRESTDTMTVAIEETDDGATRDAILAGLRTFNREHAVSPEFRPLTLSIRGPGGEIIAGLTGETGWRWLHVQLLWVASPFRRQGIGRRLLQTAEVGAVSRGCLHAYLDTFDFQARPFYEREGYHVFGIQADYPPGHQRFFLQKSLAGIDGAAPP